jgi:glycosyltransferase involved in cell wall biosynthesis
LAPAMKMPVDLLLITWNRREYLERTLPTLLADPADFRLYCWDNGSTDGTQDLIASLDDPRVIAKELHPENIGQSQPFHWFLEKGTSDCAGKVDDDILLPAGWTERFAPLLREHPTLGMLGCWIFMEEDWDAAAAEINTITVGETPVLRMTSVAGHSFLARRDLLRRYAVADFAGHGIPIDRGKMTLDQFVSGIPLPASFAHNMDDPRSPYCMYEVGQNTQCALTARRLGFNDRQAYGEWIASDARNRLVIPFQQQLRRMRLDGVPGLKGRVLRKVERYIRLPFC